MKKKKTVLYSKIPKFEKCSNKKKPFVITKDVINECLLQCQD
ncbi:MAG: hypothetical protein ACERKV_02110 [Clostridiaceae bacterium]